MPGFLHVQEWSPLVLVTVGVLIVLPLLLTVVVSWFRQRGRDGEQ
jgi:hypothetical protein